VEWLLADRFTLLIPFAGFARAFDLRVDYVIGAVPGSAVG